MSEELIRTIRDLDRGNIPGAEDHLRRELYGDQYHRGNPNAINMVNQIEMQPGHNHMHVDMYPNGQMRFSQLPDYGPGAYGQPPIVERVPVPVPVHLVLVSTSISVTFSTVVTIKRSLFI